MENWQIMMLVAPSYKFKMNGKGKKMKRRAVASDDRSMVGVTYSEYDKCKPQCLKRRRYLSPSATTPNGAPGRGLATADTCSGLESALKQSLPMPYRLTPYLDFLPEAITSLHTLSKLNYSAGPPI